MNWDKLFTAIIDAGGVVNKEEYNKLLEELK